MPVKGANNVGKAGELGRPGDKWQEGGKLSRGLNAVPGANGVAGFHDVIQIGLDTIGPGHRESLLNYAGMVPATLATHSALVNKLPGLQTYHNARRGR